MSATTKNMFSDKYGIFKTFWHHLVHPFKNHPLLSHWILWSSIMSVNESQVGKSISKMGKFKWSVTTLRREKAIKSVVRLGKSHLTRDDRHDKR